MVKGLTLVKRGVTARLLHLISTLLISTLTVSTSVHAAPIPISLDDALKRMMENSPIIKMAALGLENSKISYDIAWYSFWFPNFTLNISSTYDYTFGSMPDSLARKDSRFFHRGPPSNSMSIGLGEIKIFDFFRQRANYDKAKLDLEIAELNYQNNLRSNRMNLISIYFDTKIAQEILEAAEGSYRISQAIYENILSRKKLNKASEEEVVSSSVDLNNAKIAVVEKKNDLALKLVNLNNVLNTAPETEFRLTTEIPFRMVRLDERELIDLYKHYSPDYKILENGLAKLELDASIQEKNRIPLPTISLKPLTLSFSNGFAGGTTPTFKSDSDTTNNTIDIHAEINFNIPIYGENGLFNDRQVKQAIINRDREEINFHMTMMQTETNIRQKILAIHTLEQNLVTQKETINRNQQLLNSFFKKAATNGVDRLQLRDAISQARTSQFEYYRNLLSHLNSKYDLARSIGLDRLPGDSL